MNGKLWIAMLCFFLFLGCGTNKNTVNFSNVKKGEQLDKANEITAEQFLQMWMENEYPFKVDLNCHELFKDENYTYFGKNDLKLLKLESHLYKVRNDSLNLKLGDYNKIDGKKIQLEFWEKIIPKEDKNAWKNKECMTSYSNPVFSYELEDHKIRINLHWKVKCDGIKIFKKDYNAYYDLRTMKIED